MIHIALFCGGSAVLILSSWRVLGNPKCHGFYRFFAFEAILALLLLNEPHWFIDPLTAMHILSWGLLLLSITFIAQALYLFKRHGGHAEREAAPENLPFENTITIVEDGLYGYVRHPMYSSLCFLAWGAFLKSMTLTSVMLVLASTVFLLIVAKIEEKENISFFGSAYVDYMSRTKMFIHWVF